jgi:hypothetical protein
MQVFGFPLLVQVCFAFGMAGLFWPEKLKPVFEVLLFPWFPSYRTVRLHSLGVIALSAALFLIWIFRNHLIPQ